MPDRSTRSAGLRPLLTDRFRFEGYRSGHMMYLRDEDLETADDHIRGFIDEAVPAEGAPALGTARSGQLGRMTSPGFRRHGGLFWTVEP